MRFLFVIIFIFELISNGYSQEEKSIHQSQSEFYSKHPELIGKEMVESFQPDYELLKPTSLSKVIYGFHPYWISDATAQNYYFSLLTHFAYFSAEVDESVTTTGGFTTTRSWATSSSVTYAQTAGKKVHLTITMFDNHDRVLANAAYRTNLVNNIISTLAIRNGDGVNIDFEGISSSQATNFRTFITELGTALKSNNKELAICLPAVDWSNIFPSTFFSTNNSVVDYYFIMLYGYWWSGSSTAGPVAPLTSGTSIRHVTRSIDYYLSTGATSQRLVSGFPYYGYDWPVVSDVRMSSTTGSGTSRTFAYIQPLLDTMNSSNKFFDATYNTPWYRYQSSGNWRQTWYDDSLSLAKKYDSILVRNIAGTGMWALGYDVGYNQLWGALKNKFASTPNPQFVSLDNFESSVGHFDRSPTYSGSTVGISTSSTALLSNWQANNGWGSLEIILKDNTSSSSNWTVRLLSGTGSISNNISLTMPGLIGFWMKTSSAPSGAQIAVTIDDAAGGAELSPRLNVITDGNWNFYQWDLQSIGWSSFAGGNGVVTGPTITIDAIMFYAANNSPDWTSYIDDVNFLQTLANPISLSASAVSPSQVEISFNPNASNDNVIIVYNTTGIFTTPSGTPPANGQPFAGGTLFYNGLATPQNHSNLNPGSTYYYKAFSYDGSQYSSGLPANSTTLSPFVFSITALIEGFYDEILNSAISDTVTIELRNSSSPFSLVEQKKVVLNSSGFGSGEFILTKNATPYFIVVKHRNSVETWSKVAQSFDTGVLSFNFTTDASKAYGDNQILQGSKWCLYSGDVNQDGIVDLSDIVPIDNDAFIFASGYLPTDITGDDFIDLNDLILCDNNAFNFVGKITPETVKKQNLKSDKNQK